MRHISSLRDRQRASLLVLCFVAGLLVGRPALALECVENCIPTPSPPPRPSCSTTCIPAGRPTVTISGVAQTVRNVPLAGAVVYFTQGQAQTDANGAYSLLVWSDAPVELVVDHPKQAWQSRVVSNPALLSSRIQNFSLLYLLNVTASPDAFKTTQFSDQQVTFSVYSTAPTAGSRAPDPSA